MALNIPRVVQSLVSTTTDVARVNQNIKTALDPVLSFVGNTFSTVAGGALRIAQGISTSSVAADGAITGASYSGGPISGTSLTTTGTATVGSVVSAQGIKCILPTWYYYAVSGALSTSFTNMVLTVYSQANGTATSSMNGVWTATRAGSITGISAYFDNNGGGTVVFRWNISGTAGPTVLQTGTNASATFPKGQYTFQKGQILYIQSGFLAAGTGAPVYSANLEVELGA